MGKAISKLNVLIVEDDEITLLMMKLFLEDSGYKVSTASDGESALTSASELRPDLAIIDIGLPDFSGAQLMRELQKRYASAGIVVSGYPKNSLPADELQVFSAYLEKPLNVELLPGLIENIFSVDRQVIIN